MICEKYIPIIKRFLIFFYNKFKKNIKILKLQLFFFCTTILQNIEKNIIDNFL